MRSSLIPLFLVFLSCGKDSGSGDVSYELEKVASSQPNNRIYFQSENSQAQNYFSIDGEGIISSVGYQTLATLIDEVDITAENEGKFEIEVTFYNRDKIPYLVDNLDWEYSTEIPPTPIITFSEEATKDTEVIVIFDDSKGQNTNEVWISGDLLENSDGKWFSIPLSGQLPISLSTADGDKNLNFRYRNIFGIEGQETSSMIVKDSVAPSPCSARAQSQTVSSKFVEVELTAVDPLTLFYQISGDVPIVYGFQEFTNSERVIAKLKNEGENNLSLIHI